MSTTPPYEPMTSFHKTHDTFSHASALLLGAVLLLGVSATRAAPTTHDHTDHRQTPRLMIKPEAITLETGAAVRAYLASRHAAFGLPADLANLRLARTQTSLLGTHYHFAQFLNDIPVEHAEIVVSVSARDRKVMRIFNNTFPVNADAPALAKSKTQNDAIDAAWAHLRVHKRLLSEPRVERMYVPEGETFILVDKVHLATEGPLGRWVLKLDAATGRVLEVSESAIPRVGKRAYGPMPDFTDYRGPLLDRQQAVSAIHNKTTLASAPPSTLAVVTGSGQVFDPNPVITLMRDDLEDFSDATNFTAAYQTRPLSNITEIAGIYTLDGPWVKVMDLESPNTAPSTTTNGIWNFTRGTNAFNDAMVYFHIDQNQRYIQSLGFSGSNGIQQGQIRVDTDGAGGGDNSFYDPSDNTLSFGHGCVDDSEDADVILHEYGHAIQHAINASWFGGDTGAMGEGFSDYWAGSYRLSTPNGPTYHPEWVFSWDGHNDCWEGRILTQSNAIYSASETYGAHDTISGFVSDEYWSTPLFTSLRTLLALGRTRDEVDSIVLESHFGLGASLTMPDMAEATLLAAQGLFPTGPHEDVFRTSFLHHNLTSVPHLPAPTLLHPDTDDYFLTNAPITIAWSNNGARTSATVVIEFSTICGLDLLLDDDMEGGTNGWTVSHATGTTDWAQVSDNAFSPTTSWFAPNANSPADTFLVSPTIALEPNHVLTFWHSYDMENAFDGGVLEISTNGVLGPFTDLGNSATENGYDDTISSDFLSPIGGRQAFTGSSGGYIKTVVPLPDVTTSAHLRFRLVSDLIDGNTGWWVDDIHIDPLTNWIVIGTASPPETNLLWSAPTTPGDNYCIRAHFMHTDVPDSAFTTGGVFSVVGDDSDGDGIGFDEEVALGLNPAIDDRAVDNDSDLLSNADEVIAGTDFNNATSVFEFVSLTGNSPITLSFSSVQDRVYSLYYATNLIYTNWYVLGEAIQGSNALSSITDTNEQPLRFYRLGVQRTP